MLDPALIPISLVGAIVFGLYLVYEVVRWFAGNRGELTKAQFIRRVLGGLFLEAALVMWVINPVMAGRPTREKLVYLLVSTMLAILSMMVALREAAFVMRQYVRARSELLRNVGNRPGGDGA